MKKIYSVLVTQEDHGNLYVEAENEEEAKKSAELLMDNFKASIDMEDYDHKIHDTRIVQKKELEFNDLITKNAKENTLWLKDII